MVPSASLELQASSGKRWARRAASMPIGFCILFDPTLGFFQTGRGSKIESEWRGTKTLVFNNYSQARRSLTNLLDRSHPEKNIAGAVTVNGRHVPKDG